MFGKLLKHEFRACRADLGLYTLGVLGIGLVATVDLRILVNSAERSDNGLGGLMTVALGMLLVFSVIALAVYAIGMQVMLLYRFYKNKFTDEGYLTFTLPVKAEQIFWSSFLNMAIWMVISWAAIALVVLSMILIGTSTQGLVNWDLLPQLIRELTEDLSLVDWAYVFGMYFGDRYVVLTVVEIAKLVIAPFQALIVPMACVILGATIAKKHKILAAVAAFYVLSLVESILGSTLSMFPNILFGIASGGSNSGTYFVTMSVIDLVVAVVVTVGGYFLSVYLMKRKLNLP